jgi:hypothetical protein
VWPSTGLRTLSDKYHLSLPVPSLSRVGGWLRLFYTHTVVLKDGKQFHLFMHHGSPIFF